jgi:hypothetical protein
MSEDIDKILEDFNKEMKKNELIYSILSIIVKKLGSGEIKNNLESYYEYKKMREENSIPLTESEKIKLLHLAEQKDMEENGNV